MHVDVLRYETPEGETSYRACEAGRGEAIVAAHRRELRRSRVKRIALAAVLGLLTLAYVGLILQQVDLAVIAGGVLLITTVLVVHRRGEPGVPEPVEESIQLVDAEKRYDLDVRPS